MTAPAPKLEPCHTSEPWEHEKGSRQLWGGDKMLFRVLSAVEDSDDNGDLEASLERIVACVNAMAGIADPEAFVKAARTPDARMQALLAAAQAVCQHPYTSTDPKLCALIVELRAKGKAFADRPASPVKDTPAPAAEKVAEWALAVALAWGDLRAISKDDPDFDNKVKAMDAAMLTNAPILTLASPSTNRKAGEPGQAAEGKPDEWRRAILLAQRCLTQASHGECTLCEDANEALLSINLPGTVPAKPSSPEGGGR